MKYKVFIKDDVAYMVIPITPDTERVQPIITKEAFVECYEKWIKPIKHAHWIGIDDFPYETWECDNCGNIIETEVPPNYCERCGAKMYEIILCRDKKDA